MTKPTRVPAAGIASLECLAMLWLVGGCAAPTDFGRAIAYYADKAEVTDAAARHTNVSPYYRFNTALISELDDAIATPDEPALAEQAVAILRAANALSQASTNNEIERMPVDSREALAKLAGGDADASDLQRRFIALANAALDRDLQDMDRVSNAQRQERLKRFRRGIKPLADDKGRLQRRVTLGWAVIPTAIGIAREEAKLPEKIAAKASKAFERIAIWSPPPSDSDALIDRYAPIIAMAWPGARPYDESFDKIGAVTLVKSQAGFAVTIDPANPTVYAYESQANIGGRAYAQLNYVWWFPRRPEITEGDPVAGKIDGAMLRITFSAGGRPWFIESTLNCGCGHEVFVLQDLELAAKRAFGPPLEGKRFAIERSVSGKHDVFVVDTFAHGVNASRPLLFVAAGYHEVCRIEFDALQAIAAREVAERASYRLVSYDELDRLPVEGGIASMFGPDGLVHNAGRPEGFLLAPSGILSAGQPRKRGTQRIRWDDFLHDDPHLLEKTLRMPPLD